MSLIPRFTYDKPQDALRWYYEVRDSISHLMWHCSCGHNNGPLNFHCINCGGGCPPCKPLEQFPVDTVPLSGDRIADRIEGIVKNCTYDTSVHALQSPTHRLRWMRELLEKLCAELRGKGGEKPIYTVDAFNRLWDERMKASEILFETQRKIRRELGRELRRQSEEIARKLKEMEL